MTKSFDDYEGGAIEKGRVRFSETVTPDAPKKDYRAIIQDKHFLYEGPKWEFYRDAFNYSPLNIIPMRAYEPFLQSRNESFTKDILKRGLSGLGAQQDYFDVRAAIFHTLKQHPLILDIYSHGKIMRTAS